MSAVGQQIEQLADQLRLEFVEDAQDMLDRLDGLLAEGSAGDADVREARRMFHALKGTCSSNDFAEAGIVAMRAGDYLADLDSLRPEQCRDLQAYADAVRHALDSRGSRPLAFRETIRQLPARSSFNVADVEVREVEVLLVSAAKTLAHKVRNELAACGFRVVTISQPIAALEMALRTQPDLIVCSTVLDTMTGVDLARALAAISATQNIPFALLTSFQRGHPELNGLPMEAGIIRVGASFSDDVAEVLSRFEIG